MARVMLRSRNKAKNVRSLGFNCSSLLSHLIRPASSNSINCTGNSPHPINEHIFSGVCKRLMSFRDVYSTQVLILRDVLATKPALIGATVLDAPHLQETCKESIQSP
jgi:hypothetical protein